MKTLLLSFSSFSIFRSVLVTLSFCSEGDYLSPEVSSGTHSQSTPKKSEEKSNSLPAYAHSGSTLKDAEAETSSGIAILEPTIANLFILLCCETALYLHSLKTMIEVSFGVFSTFPPFLICFC